MSKKKAEAGRSRFWQTKVNQVDRLLAGAEVGAVRWVDCQTKGCGERLAEIRYERDDAISFEVRAPVHADGPVTVLERPARADQPVTVVHSAVDRDVFRCPRCGRDTPVNLTVLRAVRSGIDKDIRAV